MTLTDLLTLLRTYYREAEDISYVALRRFIIAIGYSRKGIHTKATERYRQANIDARYDFVERILMFDNLDCSIFRDESDSTCTLSATTDIIR